MQGFNQQDTAAIAAPAAAAGAAAAAAVAPGRHGCPSALGWHGIAEHAPTPPQ